MFRYGRSFWCEAPPPRPSRTECALLKRQTRTQWSLVVAALIACAAGLSAEVVPESRLKAAILSKFPQFIEWPDGAVEGRQTIDICLAAPDPFGADLQDMVNGEELNGRTLAVRRVDAPTQVPACHVLFLPARSDARRTLLAAARRLPVLTVSDDPDFLDAGGIVALRLVDGRVRFEVNDGAARGVGLRISSQLLRLALSVRGGER
jgi:hypothetical protein